MCVCMYDLCLKKNFKKFFTKCVCTWVNDSNGFFFFTNNWSVLCWITMVTKFPNHWWASSCPTTSATHCLDDEQEFFGSISSAVSLENTDLRLNLVCKQQLPSPVQSPHQLLGCSLRKHVRRWLTSVDELRLLLYANYMSV